MIDLSLVQPRKEGEIIPQGASLTITSKAQYLRVRSEDDIVTIRLSNEGLLEVWTFGDVKYVD